MLPTPRSKSSTERALELENQIKFGQKLNLGNGKSDRIRLYCVDLWLRNFVNSGSGCVRERARVGDSRNPLLYMGAYARTLLTSLLSRVLLIISALWASYDWDIERISASFLCPHRFWVAHDVVSRLRDRAFSLLRLAGTHAELPFRATCFPRYWATQFRT